MASKKNESGVAAALGVAAAAVGAAAAGFFLYGPKGKDTRVKLKAWTLKAKGDVLEQIEKAKEVTDQSYAEVVDKVTAKYAKLKNVGEEEAAALNKELKRHWKAIKLSASNKKKPAAKKKKASQSAVAPETQA